MILPFLILAFPTTLLMAAFIVSGVARGRTASARRAAKRRAPVSTSRRVAACAFVASV